MALLDRVGGESLESTTCYKCGVEFAMPAMMGGDMSEWPQDLRVREFLEVRA